MRTVTRCKRTEEEEEEKKPWHSEITRTGSLEWRSENLGFLVHPPSGLIQSVSSLSCGRGFVNSYKHAGGRGQSVCPQSSTWRHSSPTYYPKKKTKKNQDGWHRVSSSLQKNKTKTRVTDVTTSTWTKSFWKKTWQCDLCATETKSQERKTDRDSSPTSDPGHAPKHLANQSINQITKANICT